MKIATGREPDYRKVDGGYVTGITYCDTDFYAYATKVQPDGECLRYGGGTDFDRCAACPHLVDYHEEFSVGEPVATVAQCAYGDLRYNVRRAGCRRCSKRYSCLSLRLQKGGRVVLVQIRKKKG